MAFQDASRKASALMVGGNDGLRAPQLVAALMPSASMGMRACCLPAYAVAISAAYIPVKFACLEAGCCQLIAVIRL